MGNNLKKLFFTVFLEIKLKRKVAGIIKVWERPGISQLPVGKRAYSDKGNVRKVQ